MRLRLFTKTFVHILASFGHRIRAARYMKLNYYFSTTHKRKLVLVLILLTIISISIFLYVRLKHKTYEQVPFESQKWLTSSIEDRFLMYRDLLDGRILIDKTENEIEKILGKPNYIWKDEQSYEWEYNLGYQESAASLMFPYNNWLHVLFQEDKKVEKAYLINHD